MKMTILRRIRQAHTLRTCQKILSDFIMEFSEFVRDKRSGERSEILKIKEYVQLHYSENIDLNLVAGLVNVTPSHLSNLFKKETGHQLLFLPHRCADAGSWQTFKIPGHAHL